MEDVVKFMQQKNYPDRFQKRTIYLTSTSPVLAKGQGKVKKWLTNANPSDKMMDESEYILIGLVTIELSKTKEDYDLCAPQVVSFWLFMSASQPRLKEIVDPARSQVAWA